jgi:hypothetical protein
MTADPSSNEPLIDLYSEQWWQEVASPNIHRCVAHRKNGNQCRHAAMNGATVCQTHGGRAPQVKLKAKQRLEEATLKNAKYLLEMCADTMIPEGVRLAAIKDALDRGGLGAKSSMEIEVSAKPFEKVFTKIVSGPRTIEGEIVDEPEEEQPGSLKARLLMRNEVDEYSDVVPRVEDLNGDSNG